ncbi:MAG: hypothetical protein JXJ20_11475 [Anaerolineae bacterium]|nr:hypothetical protein [Anaerolineae bacterium]
MNKWGMRIGVVVLVAVMALGVVGVAAAQGPENKPDRPRDRVTGPLLDAIAEATGLSVEELRDQVRDGKTLAEVCEEYEVDTEALLAEVKADIAATVDETLDDALNRALNAHAPVRPFEPLRDRFTNRMENTLVAVLAEMADLDVKDITQTLRQDGGSLADIAEANGVEVDAVVEEAVARLTEDLQAAVDDGSITQAQMDEALDAAALLYPDMMTMPFAGRPRLVWQTVEERLDSTLVGVVAELADVEPRDILKEWRDAGTLADVVEAYELDVAAVVDETEARITEDVNQAVADEKISQEQADWALDGLRDRLEWRMDASYWWARPAGGPDTRGAGGQGGGKGPGGQST